MSDGVVDPIAEIESNHDTAAVEDDKALIAEITELALATAAPDELVVFGETAQEYFADPQAALSSNSGGDTAVGFGLELAMITPIALAVGSAVVQALMGHLAGRAVEAGERGVGALVRKVFRIQAKQAKPAEPAEITLTPIQAQHIRYVAWEKARALGMPDAQARVLADSFVGAIVTSG